MKRIVRNFLTFAAITAGTTLAVSPANALFLAFEGGTIEHAAFQSAAGPTNLETFDSFASGTQIFALPGLGIGFGEIASGLFPGVYLHNVNNTPSQPFQLSNMPSGTPDPAHQFADIVINATGPGSLNAFAFWNGDPQGNVVASAFDADDNLLGSVSAVIHGGFAGFVTDGAVSHIIMNGNVGDGYNHVDDFETAFDLFTDVPAPGAAAIFVFALAALAFRRRA